MIITQYVCVLNAEVWATCRTLSRPVAISFRCKLMSRRVTNSTASSSVSPELLHAARSPSPSPLPVRLSSPFKRRPKIPSAALSFCRDSLSGQRTPGWHRSAERACRPAFCSGTEPFTRAEESVGHARKEPVPLLPSHYVSRMAPRSTLFPIVVAVGLGGSRSTFEVIWQCNKFQRYTLRNDYERIGLR